MTTTLISLISILIGIIGANAMGVFYPKYSFGFIGNTILGVFGGAFLIKSIGRLGFDPKSVMGAGTVDLTMLSVNMLVSFLGGVMAVFIVCLMKNFIKHQEEKNRN
ncbi:MAG: hypothetical protein COB60_10455 [Flavobacteriaceae bacterium]|nr:MAG: hypothetical protein COB60_10455 [Flavobacteriaceae bacterium]